MDIENKLFSAKLNLFLGKVDNGEKEFNDNCKLLLKGRAWLISMKGKKV